MRRQHTPLPVPKNLIKSLPRPFTLNRLMQSGNRPWVGAGGGGVRTTTEPTKNHSLLKLNTIIVYIRTSFGVVFNNARHTIVVVSALAKGRLLINFPLDSNADELDDFRQFTVLSISYRARSLYYRALAWD